MKKLFLTLSILIVITSVIFAAFIYPYNNAKPPGIPLPVAYERAANALGAATNQFHCVSATIATSFSPDGEWFFTFYSTNSKPKWVTVEFNGKIHVENFILR